MASLEQVYLHSQVIKTMFSSRTEDRQVYKLPLVLVWGFLMLESSLCKVAPALVTLWELGLRDPFSLLSLTPLLL